jgi:4-diphosphocytidyl-2-C-methyl-D-erythritol kinase
MDVACCGSFVRVHTPAKLNLFLEVIAKRDDGFHEIETLMVAITLYDTLDFERGPKGETRLTWQWATGAEAGEFARGRTQRPSTAGRVPGQQDNLVWKAAERLRRHAGIDTGLNVRLVKRIPSEAGFGGASSDAAATLVGANHIWQLGWSRARLAQIAAELGSDVPFFLTSAPRGAEVALCRGRGERIEPISGIPRLYFALVRPATGLSTASVYQRCRPAESAVSARRLCEALRSGNPATIGRRLLNRLQPIAEELSPAVRETRNEFQRLDCLGHQMSGSGSGYFAICRNARHARRMHALVRARGLGTAFWAHTVMSPRGPLPHSTGPEGERPWRSPRFASN